MRMILAVLTGFFAGSAAVAVVAVIPHTPSAAGLTAAPSNHPSAMAAGMAVNTAGRPTMPKTHTVSLTIQHVLHGCHVWSNGKRSGVMMRLHLKQGQALSITDMDVDAHKMMQLAGPMHMQMGAPMMSADGIKMMFTRKGVYRFGTRTVEMPGMGGMADVKTIGPDNKLRLVVTVA